MINHAEAQSLVSARMDEPLDPIVARELDAHLATCPQCRAFANQTAAMSQALHDLPHLPANPRVRRAVLDTVQKPQTPWTRFQGLFATGPAPAFSTIAAILVVGLLSVFVLTRLLGEHDAGDTQTTLLAPSIETTRESDVAQANPTATVDSGALTVPPQATEPANVIPTTAPTQPVDEPTTPPTDVPTEPPTATQPAPTEAAAPTEQTARSDTEETGSNSIRIAGKASTSPEAATETPGPTETAGPTDTPESVETPEPSETPFPTDTPAPTATETAEPVETVAPTDEPTEPPVPTETVAPTEAATATPTEGSPRIESTTGTYVPAEPETTPTEVAATEPALATEEPSEAAPAPTTESGGLIEPAGTATTTDTGPTIAPETDVPGQDQTIPNDGTGGATTEIVPSGDTATPDTQEPSADPGRSLGLTEASARIEASGDSWAPVGDLTAPQFSPDGLTIGTDREGRLAVCTPAGECQGVVSSRENRGTTPAATSERAIGWMGSSLIYEAPSGDGQVTYHEVTVRADGTIGEDRIIGTGDAATGTSYVFGDGLLIETESGWFSTSSGFGVTTDPPVSNRQLVRLYPDRGFVGSLVDGSIVFENVNNGAVIAKVPTAGNDFDLSSDDQVVVSTGHAIEIWDLYGGIVATYTPPSGNSVGSVAWSGTDILYVDTTTGEVRLISPSDFGPGST